VRHVLCIADDLTGSNATAILFRNLGWKASTVVEWFTPISQRLGNPGVTVWNAGTRLLPRQEAVERINTMVGQSGVITHPDVQLCKRIDSTFRGNVGAETQALLEVLTGPRLAVVVGAYPASGRTVVGGNLFLHGVPIHETEIGKDPQGGLVSSSLKQLLALQTSLPVYEMTKGWLDDFVRAERQVQRYLNQRCFLVCDAQSDEDIQRTAQFFASLAEPILPVDPGPFSAAYVAARQRRLGRVLVVSGSRSKLTTDQLDHAEQELGVKWTDVHPMQLNDPLYAQEVSYQLAESFTSRGVAGMRTDRVRLSSDEQQQTPSILANYTKQLVDNLLITGLYLTGGEVARAVLTALSVSELEPLSETCPLGVLCHAISGPYEGLPVVTKGGSVGQVSSIYDSVCALQMQAAFNLREGTKKCTNHC
jgi:uncharacterized protein YgbK (DUF1537 family)